MDVEGTRFADILTNRNALLGRRETNFSVFACDAITALAVAGTCVGQAEPSFVRLLHTLIVGGVCTRLGGCAFCGAELVVGSCELNAPLAWGSASS